MKLINYFLFVFICLFMWYVYIPWHECGSQRKTWRSWFSVLHCEIQVVMLGFKHPYSLSHSPALTPFKLLFLK